MRSDSTAHPWIRLLTAALIVGCLLTFPAGAAYSSEFNFPPAAFNIWNADGTKIIGHGSYEVSHSEPGFLNAFGENRYDDGEYDVERDKLELRGADQLPMMVSFEHFFYHADRSPERKSSADFRSGQASCVSFTDGVETDRTDRFNFTPDTYAGAAIIIPLQDFIAKGGKGKLTLRALNCVPGPKVLAVSITLEAGARWSHYPGPVTEVDVKPDFGWLNLVLAPFLPEMRAWFADERGWHFVGGRFSRYYRGPEIILARVPGATTATTASIPSEHRRTTR